MKITTPSLTFPLPGLTRVGIAHESLVYFLPLAKGEE
jgi:hypothetical protein